MTSYITHVCAPTEGVVSYGDVTFCNAPLEGREYSIRTLAQRATASTSSFLVELSRSLRSSSAGKMLFRYDLGISASAREAEAMIWRKTKRNKNERREGIVWGRRTRCGVTVPIDLRLGYMDRTGRRFFCAVCAALGALNLGKCVWK